VRDGLDPRVIIESIVTTVALDGTVNCAPMGVEWDGPMTHRSS
jgi:hypothetical protein